MTAVLVLLLSLLLTPTRAEHRRFDGPISAASNYIHYSEGYVVTPGYVDISELEFEAVSEKAGENKLFQEGMVVAEGVDDEYVDDEYVDDDGGGGGGGRGLEDGVATVSILLFVYHRSWCM